MHHTLTKKTKPSQELLKSVWKWTNDWKHLILIYSTETHRMKGGATRWKKVKSQYETERADWSTPALVRVYFYGWRLEPCQTARPPREQLGLTEPRHNERQQCKSKHKNHCISTNWQFYTSLSSICQSRKVRWRSPKKPLYTAMAKVCIVAK